MNARLRGRRYIVVSLLLVAIVQLLPISAWLSPWRPILPIVAIAFWAYIVPAHVGVLSGFLYGLVIEAALGMGILQLALPCALVALVVQHVYMKLRSYSVVQQALYLGVVVVLAVSSALPFDSLPYHDQLWRVLARSFVVAALLWASVIIGFEAMGRRYVVAREQ